MTELSKVVVYCDGSCWPNPGGDAGWGWWAKRDDAFIEEGYGYIGYGTGMTNNVAEYIALIEGLEWAKRQEVQIPFVFLLDSNLVVQTVTRQWKARQPHLIPLCSYARALKDEINADIRWIPRRYNEYADELSRRYAVVEYPPYYRHPLFQTLSIDNLASVI